MARDLQILSPELAVVPNAGTYDVPLVVPEGNTADFGFSLKNNGDAPLTVTAISFLSTGISQSPLQTPLVLPLVIAAGDSVEQDVRIAGTPRGTYARQWRVSSNDPDTPAYTATVAGYIAYAPVYATRADVEAEGGTGNVTAYADLEGNRTANQISAAIDDSLAFADAFIAGRLSEAGYTVPLVAYPAGSTGLAGWVMPILKAVARKLALWHLYTARGQQDVEATDPTADKMTGKYKWAVAELDRLIAQGIPAETDPDADVGGFVMVEHDPRPACGVGDEFSSN